MASNPSRSSVPPPKSRREPEEAQDAEIVFANALVGVADETDATRGEVVEAAKRVVNAAVRVERQGVDGEVAPARVGKKIAPEHDLGVAAVRFDVLPQGRGLDRTTVHDQRDRAVGEAGRRDRETGRRGASHRFARRSGRGEVEIARLQAEGQVAHRPADDPRLDVSAVQRLESARERPPPEVIAIPEPAILQAGKPAHSKCPGTSAPFS